MVVGSKSHSLADKCINWGEDFYVGDYNVLVIHLKDLTPDQLDYLKTNKPDYIENMRKQIVEAQQEGLEVFCILDTFKFAKNVTKHNDDDTKKAWNNYAWSPIIPKLENVPEGKKINHSSSKLSPDYLKLIKDWAILWENSINNTGYTNYNDLQNGRVIRTKIITNFLLENTIGRCLSFEAGWTVREENSNGDYVFETLYSTEHPIVFLPKTEDDKKAIDIILAQLSKLEEELPPEWVTKLDIGNEKEIVSKIGRIKSEITAKEKEISVLEKDLNDLNEYKKLLYSSGHTLEEITEKSFKTLGISIISPNTKNIEDRLFIKGDALIPIEIRGKNSGLNEKDLNQLTSRFVDKPESTTFQTRGVFILNHFRDIEPQNRDEAFIVNIIEKAKPWKVCLLKTSVLFELVKLKLSGKEILDLENLIFNTIGVYEIPKKP